MNYSIKSQARGGVKPVRKGKGTPRRLAPKPLTPTEVSKLQTAYVKAMSHIAERGEKNRRGQFVFGNLAVTWRWCPSSELGVVRVVARASDTWLVSVFTGRTAKPNGIAVHVMNRTSLSAARAVVDIIEEV